MSTLGNIFVLLGLVGSVWGIIRLLRQRKHPLTKRLNLIMLIGGIILVIVGSPMANTKAASGSPHQSSSVSKTKALTAKQQSRLDAEKAHGKILLAVKAKKVAELKALKNLKQVHRQRLPVLLPHHHPEQLLRRLPRRHRRAKLPRLNKPPQHHRKQLPQHKQPNKPRRHKSQPLTNKPLSHNNRPPLKAEICIQVTKAPSSETAVAKFTMCLVKLAIT